MANPKRRHSNTRTRTRRAHDFLKLRSPSTCSQCGAQIIPHRICPQCGYYNGRQLISIEVEEEKKKEE